MGRGLSHNQRALLELLRADPRRDSSIVQLAQALPRETLEYGFPGPAAHRYMYIWLKERSLREVSLEAQDGQNRRVMLITGVCSSESQRRMGHVEPVQRDGNDSLGCPDSRLRS